MTLWPPHKYRRQGVAQRVPADSIELSLGEAHRVQAKDLPAILSLGHLAYLTSTPYEYLRKVAGRRHDPYEYFRIAKRRGGTRSIVAVEPLLRSVQQWLNANVLRVLAQSSLHPASSAYAPGNSIVQCAAKHAQCRWLVKVDVHKFFESISEIDVYRVFRRAGYSALVSFELARLCTRRLLHDPWPRWAVRPRKRSIQAYMDFALGHTPQGAPTSPLLANLVATRLDGAVQAIADAYGMQYTRYSDDLVLSKGDDPFGRAEGFAVVRAVSEALRAFGFRPNDTKTVIVPPGARKIVLGLLVDGPEPRLTRSFKDRLRSHIYHIKNNGPVVHSTIRLFRSTPAMIAHVKGLIDHATSVERSYGEAALSSLREALSAHGLVLRDFG